MFPWWSDIVVGDCAVGLGVLFGLSLIIPAFGSKFLAQAWPSKQTQMEKRRQAVRAVVIHAIAWVVWGTGFIVGGLVEQFGQRDSLWEILGYVLRIVGPFLLFIAFYQQRGLHDGKERIVQRQGISVIKPSRRDTPNKSFQGTALRGGERLRFSRLYWPVTIPAPTWRPLNSAVRQATLAGPLLASTVRYTTTIPNAFYESYWKCTFASTAKGSPYVCNPN